MLYDGEVGEAPWLWVKFQLCRLFHCTPADLDGNDIDELLLMLELYAEYQRVLETRRVLEGGSA